MHKFNVTGAIHNGMISFCVFEPAQVTHERFQDSEINTNAVLRIALSLSLHDNPGKCIEASGFVCFWT